MNETKSAETIGVMIASYRRPVDLQRCLAGVDAQTRPADDVMVVVRDGDDATAEALRDWASPRPVRIVRVAEPGLVAARNAGIAECRTDVLAMTDDDAVPCPDWLSRILDHFRRDPGLGGLGGRDRPAGEAGIAEAPATVVGRLQWVGRALGNHHRGAGGARSVDLLKGANMSYRAEVFRTVRFDTRLRGAGAQPNEDMAFSIQVRRRGWCLVYDSEVLVDHYERPREEPRFYAGDLSLSDVEGFRDLAFNEVTAIWDVLPPARRLAFVLWSALVGTRISPGLVQAVRFTPRLGRLSWRRFAITQQGKWQAIREMGWVPSALNPAPNRAR